MRECEDAYCSEQIRQRGPQAALRGAGDGDGGYQQCDQEGQVIAAMEDVTHAFAEEADEIMAICASLRPAEVDRLRRVRGMQRAPFHFGTRQRHDEAMARVDARQETVAQAAGWLPVSTDDVPAKDREGGAVAARQRLEGW